MHVWSGYPLYNSEADQRWHSYPPPYYYQGQWWYATPWLWIDGDPHGSYIYSQWESKIVDRMNQPAPVTATMWGYYVPASNSGTIFAQFRNDSTAAISGYVLFVITEDSVYVPTMPNGDDWHNQVARDYLPDHIGMPVSVPAGDSVTVSQPFTIGASWNEEKCKIVAWIQDEILQPDSIKEIWQGCKIDLSELGIEEQHAKDIYLQKINPAPNPCVNGTNFSFNLPAGVEYRINIFDIIGRHVKTLSGISSGRQEVIAWDLKDDTGTQLGAGVYLFRFESNEVNTAGKIVVR
ncbi:MAG: T9SS type A sorting domain-containing protein [candidate division WOR-3 bacterium]|nr:MAG: T9SS type A sorting domain-containing protein [candidate division WOR-3 bacterium]